MRDLNIKSMTFTGLFAALIFLATYALHVPAGVNGGYVHFGDALVYAAAAMLPLPNAMVAAAIGAGLSDLLSPGAAVWVLPTVIIKSLCCLPFSGKADKLLTKRNVLAIFISGLLTTFGYCVATAVIAGGFAVAVAEIPLSLIQASGSGAAFAAIAAAIDKTGIKARYITR